ncbi:hypothetical protein ADUPG1_010926, partial [Aduncisulcus paluster]
IQQVSDLPFPKCLSVFPQFSSVEKAISVYSYLLDRRRSQMMDNISNSPSTTMLSPYPGDVFLCVDPLHSSRYSTSKLSSPEYIHQGTIKRRVSSSIYYSSTERSPSTNPFAINSLGSSRIGTSPMKSPKRIISPAPNAKSSPKSRGHSMQMHASRLLFRLDLSSSSIRSFCFLFLSLTNNSSYLMDIYGEHVSPEQSWWCLRSLVEQLSVVKAVLSSPMFSCGSDETCGCIACVWQCVTMCVSVVHKLEKEARRTAVRTGRKDFMISSSHFSHTSSISGTKRPCTASHLDQGSISSRHGSTSSQFSTQMSQICSSSHGKGGGYGSYNESGDITEDTVIEGPKELHRKLRSMAVVVNSVCSSMCDKLKVCASTLIALWGVIGAKDIKKKSKSASKTSVEGASLSFKSPSTLSCSIPKSNISMSDILIAQTLSASLACAIRIISLLTSLPSYDEPMIISNTSPQISTTSLSARREYFDSFGATIHSFKSSLASLMLFSWLFVSAPPPPPFILSLFSVSFGMATNVSEEVCKVVCKGLQKAQEMRKDSDGSPGNGSSRSISSFRDDIYPAGSPLLPCFLGPVHKTSILSVHQSDFVHVLSSRSGLVTSLVSVGDSFVCEDVFMRLLSSISESPNVTSPQTSIDATVSSEVLSSTFNPSFILPFSPEIISPIGYIHGIWDRWRARRRKVM